MKGGLTPTTSVKVKRRTATTSPIDVILKALGLFKPNQALLKDLCGLLGHDGREGVMEKNMKTTMGTGSKELNELINELERKYHTVEVVIKGEQASITYKHLKR